MENKTDIAIETYDNIVNEYVAYYNSKALKGNVQFQKEIDYMTSKLKRGAQILDVGTSIGSYPKFLTEKCNKNFKVTGIDTSKNFINIAKKNAPRAEFKIMDMRNICFNEKSFDGIICFATLTHVNDETCLSILDKFDAILKNNGLITINVQELRPNEEKETFEPEPLNPKYNNYFNRYTKVFFADYFIKMKYKIIGYYDNPMFNTETVGGRFNTVNQFSIIVKKARK